MEENNIEVSAEVLQYFKDGDPFYTIGSAEGGEKYISKLPSGVPTILMDMDASSTINKFNGGYGAFFCVTTF